MEGEHIHMSCSMAYGVGETNPEDITQWAPVMDWTGPRGEIPPENVTDESTVGYSTYSINIKVDASTDGSQYHCSIYFEPPVAELYYAANTPDYTYGWSSPVLTINSRFDTT